MKKYLLGLFAIVLAVGFSAFTNTSKVVKPKKASQDYYWYPVSSGLISGPAINSAAFMDKGEATTNNPFGCHDLASEVCLVGETSSTLSVGTTPSAPTPDEDNRIKKDE
jgi:hypothetical protein